MAPAADRVKNSPKLKMLTMDVVELTLLLKSIGFRLDSIDYDEIRSWCKRANDCGNGNSASATTTTNADQHYISVEISCSKSKIVSNLSFQINDNNEIAETDVLSLSEATTDPTKFMACTCPKRESRSSSNSFWEVQRSGTFANQRRSVNGLLNGETGIDHETSSNLLPVLSTKSIALTNVLAQVLLNQYKNNSPFGESIAKDVDIKSILLAVEKSNATSNGKVSQLPRVISKGEDLNLITPLSSMNATPNEQDAFGNDTNGVEFIGKNTSLNETVNTEAFSSPRSDLITSSPHAGGAANERDAGIISHLNQARRSIDRALLSMKLNVTKSVSHESVAVRTIPVTQDILADKNQNRYGSTQSNRKLNGRTTSALVSVRAPALTKHRRASLGSTVKMPTGNVCSPAIPSRMNVARSNSVERPVNATSKLSLTRRTMSGMGASAISTTAKKPTEQPTTTATAIKRSTSINLRRLSSPAMISTGTINTLTTRKTVATTKLTSLPPKIAKK